MKKKKIEDKFAHELKKMKAAAAGLAAATRGRAKVIDDTPKDDKAKSQIKEGVEDYNTKKRKRYYNDSGGY